MAEFGLKFGKTLRALPLYKSKRKAIKAFLFIIEERKGV
jgi:hypothetical protein